MLAFLRNSKVFAVAVLAFFVLAPMRAIPAAAEERFPEVARLSFVSGAVTLSRGDDPDEWDDVLENAPLTVGDRLYTAADSRAELQLPAGNFIRLAPQSYLSTLNLGEDVKQFFLGEGVASIDIRRLASDEVFEFDTPNVSVTLDEPGRYRIAVDENGDSRIAVRRGRASVAASGRQLTVENSEIRIYGIDAPRYEIVGLPGGDAFDAWVAERSDRFERAYTDAYRYTSEDVIGAEELAGSGRWEQIPEYGYAWTPTMVAAGWSPFSHGRWYWKDPWGWSWISHDRWGWATSHYGRWTPYRSRWYWVPVRPRTRVRYAPACVEFIRVRDHVGWFPLHPRDRHIPWWERRGRRFDGNPTFVNRHHVTVIHHNHFIATRAVHRHLVREAVILRDARSARFVEALPIPSRSSLRLVAEDARHRGFKPSGRVLGRVAVVRTAPSHSPRGFHDKLAEIQKNQGRPVEAARLTAAAPDDRRAGHVRVRPAAEIGAGNFAPRNPGGSGPALQPVTEARGKPLEKRAVRSEPERTETPSTAQTPVKAEPASSAAEQKRRVLERAQQARSKAQSQQQTAPAKPNVPDTWEQRRLEALERQTRQGEQASKAQENRQEQARQEALKQQQARQAEQQKRREAARREQTLQQQNQARREFHVRQQQAIEQQAREAQRRQETERRQLQQPQSQERALQQRPEQLRLQPQLQIEREAQQIQRQEQARQQQLRQQQLQTQREAQQIQRHQQQERRQQMRQLPPQQRPGVAQPQLQQAR